MRILAILLTLFSVQAQAGQTLFLFKKNLNPKNVLHYSVDMNAANCALTANKNVYVTPYWVMGESDGHIEGLTSKETKIFTPVVSYMNAAKTELDFNVAAVDLIKQHIPNPEISVKTSKAARGCVAKAYMDVDNLEIEIKEIYISGSITWTLDWKTDYLVITGLKPDGSAFKKKIVP